MFVLQYVQPGLAGLMDGSVSTLAPLFAAAFATHQNWQTFLVGLAARRSWLTSNRALATSVARLFAASNAALRDDPSLFIKYSGELGLRPRETAAINLLPERMADVYPPEWDQSVWSAIDRQIELAVKLRLLDAAPDRPLYDGQPLGKV